RPFPIGLIRADAKGEGMSFNVSPRESLDVPLRGRSSLLRRMSLGLVVCVVSCCGLSCNRANDKRERPNEEAKNMAPAAPDDHSLRQTVKLAADRGLDPDEAERFVKIPPTGSTRNESQRQWIHRKIDFVEEPGGPPFPCRTNDIKDIVYWVTSVDSGHPRVVVLIWTKDGNCIFFPGMIADPN